MTIKIFLGDKSGYGAVGEYVKRFWEHHAMEQVIVSLKTSYDGETFENHKEVVIPTNSGEVEFLYDWWEGERYIQLDGIKAISEIDISGGLYLEEIFSFRKN